MRSILIVDPDRRESRRIASLLAEDFETDCADDDDEGREKLRARPFDLVLVSLDFEDAERSLDFVEEVAASDHPPKVVCASERADTTLAVKAGRRGAEEFATKPYALPQLRKKLLDATPTARSRRDKARARRASPLIGESELMLEVKRTLALYGAYDYPVLILGESGTGKDLAARDVHAQSSRAARPFVALNCGAIPSQLAESELFGTERGAFTGAIGHPGAWERANGGTLFLDEIGALSPDVQVKLLRALESGEVLRLGGCVPMRSDVRILAATNADIKPGGTAALRNDLYYRLNTLSVTMPPLRKRVEDIPLLVEHLSRTCCDGKRVDGAAMRTLETYAWPGNVRQLRNTLCRSTVNAHEAECIETRHIRFDDE